MKRTYKRISMALAVSLTMGLTTACSSSSGSSGSTASTYSTYEELSGGCYNETTATYVSSTYCTSTSTTSSTLYNSNYFAWSGSSCISRVNSQVVNTEYCETNSFSWSGSNCWDSISQTYVSTAYCSNNTATTGTLTTTASTTTTYACAGWFYYYTYGTYEPVYCSYNDCAGYTLFTSSLVKVVCD